MVSAKSCLRSSLSLLLAAVLPVLLVVLAPPASALSTDTTSTSGAAVPEVPWTSYLAGTTDAYIPSSEDDCTAGRSSCLKTTLKELARIADTTAEDCSHDAVFARSYLRMTQTYGWSRDIPGYYADVPFANHQDAVFAKYYSDAYHAYQAGDRADVPESWQIAFDASRDKQVGGAASLLLGMNAHINRDLAFVLAGVGLVAPDGSSRKPDYDVVEKWLYTATRPLIAEVAARFDQTADDATDPWGISYSTLFQMISAWREEAWRHAEQLVSAPTAADRAQVAASIEAEATAAAKAILATNSYTPPLTTSGPRDAWCAAHHDDAPPLPYDFGTAQPYGY